MEKLFGSTYIFVLAMLIFSAGDVKSQTNFIYGKQFGTSEYEGTYNPVSDNDGNVYIAGTTKGNMSGQNVGQGDGFVTKLDSAGNIIWTKQFGTKEDEKIAYVAIDPMGNLFVTGYTKGNSGRPNHGGKDVLVAKLDRNGNLKWQKQYGTDSMDIGKCIYADIHGNIYITGDTKGKFGDLSYGKDDCFLLKLDNEGNKIFVHQFGTIEDDRGFGITGDISSDIYICGITQGDLAAKNKGMWDAFVAKFNVHGEQLKTIQYGTDNVDFAVRITVDNEKNTYLGGSTHGDYAGRQQGNGDCLLIKMNEKGQVIWSQQFGTPNWDGINGIDIKEQLSQHIVISGCKNYPSCQSFCRVYDKDGSLIWVGNYLAKGDPGGTCGKGVCLDEKGYIYHVGKTGGNLFNTSKGEHDVFILKLELDKGSTEN